jgi:hypothetical protein
LFQNRVRRWLLWAFVVHKRVQHLDHLTFAYYLSCLTELLSSHMHKWSWASLSKTVIHWVLTWETAAHELSRN